MPKQVEEMLSEADKLQEEVVNDQDIDGYLDGLDEEDENNQDVDINDQDYKHKYEVLQGKYNTELGRANDMLSKTLTDNERLKLALGVSSTDSSDEHFSDDLEPEITTIKKEYPSLAKGIEALAKRVVADSMKETINTVNANTELGRRETYVSKLDSVVPDWRTINDDPDFIKWLQTKEKYTGVTKHQLLMNAWNTFNTDATKAFFEDYKKEIGLEDNSDIDNDNEDSTFRDKPKNKKVKNEDIALDNSSDSIPKNATSKKNIISQAEISKFYRDRAMGKFSGTEEEAAKLEAKILRAVQEGRVR